MARINVAYEVLSNPQRRAEYDRQRGPSSDYTSYTPPYEPPPADYSATSDSGRESRNVRRQFTTVPVRAAAQSAAAVIKWQVGFFGRPISIIAGVIALLAFVLLGFSDSMSAALFALPFAVITFFWWWFLASVVLFVAWKASKRGTAIARSLIQALRYAKVREADSVVQSEDSPNAGDQDASWQDLRTHLAVLGRTARGFILGTARFFGWPISIIALLLMLWTSGASVAETTLSDTLSPFGTSSTGGELVAAPVWLVIFVLSWPAFIMSMFVIWLICAVILFTVWQLAKLLFIVIGRLTQSRDEAGRDREP